MTADPPWICAGESRPAPRPPPKRSFGQPQSGRRAQIKSGHSGQPARPNGHGWSDTYWQSSEKDGSLYGSTETQKFLR
jgi:hypothetical protein